MLSASAHRGEQMNLVIRNPTTVARVLESRTVVVSFDKKSSLQEVLHSSYLAQKASQLLFRISDVLASPGTIGLGIIPFFGAVISGVEYLDAKDQVQYYQKFIKNPQEIKFKGIFDTSYYQNRYNTCVKNQASLLKAFKITLIVTIAITALFILGLMCEIVAINLKTSVDAKIKTLFGTRDEVLKQLDHEPKSLILADSFFFYDDEVVAKALEKDFSNINILPKDIAKQMLLAMIREDISYDQKIPDYLKSDMNFMEQVREINHPLELDN